MVNSMLALPEMLTQAVGLYQSGQLAKAAALCDAILYVNADHFEANHLLGVIQTGFGHWQEALANYDRALAINPASAQLLTNRSAALRLLDRFEEALVSCERAL